MVSIGGITMNGSQEAFQEAQRSKDPWDEGLGVFDVTDMEWKNGYDANDPPHGTPNIVKAYYKTNGLEPAPKRKNYPPSPSPWP